MKIIKPLTLGLLHKPYRYRGQHHFCIAALGFFRLGQDNERYLTENLQWPLVAPLLPFGHPLDELMPKLRSEVLLSGQAYAPSGQCVRETEVRLCVAGIDKRLRVLGERRWEYGLLPLLRITPPQPFAAMPLVYARAFGGPAHPANPAGCGYTGSLLGAFYGQNAGSMPNIEYPDQPVRSPARRLAPAGYGPIDMSWSPRREKHGTFDQRWIERDAPGLAEDVDWSLFNRAPADQWLPRPLAGGECYRLENLHPSLPIIEGHLPQAQARAFVVRAGGAAADAEEVAMAMDTIWFFPEQQLGVAVYHGQTTVADSDALDIAALMVGYEHPAAPKSLDHYREVFALRLAPATAALCAFNESQLAPTLSPEAQALRIARRQETEAAARAKQQAVLDELHADFWRDSGMTPPPGQQSPQALALPLPTWSAEDLEQSDFDLGEMVAQARTLATEARADGEALLARAQAELDAAPPVLVVPVDPAAQRNAAFERASTPAYDLLAPALRQLDPHWQALMDAVDQAEQAGQPLSPATREQLRQGLIDLTAQRRLARRAAPEPAVPDLPLAPDTARWLGQEVCQWQQGGALLAGRDLAGIDLAGADFSDADLRETLFEGADLRGANFAGANLEGAVLCGARLDGACFAGARLQQANLCQTSASQGDFRGADLSGASATGAVWQGANLGGARLDGLLALRIDLGGACLDGASLRRATLLEASAGASQWRGAVLEQTVLLGAGLEGADFSGATLHKTVLLDARLGRSIWRAARLNSIAGGGKADWRGAQMQAAMADSCGWHGADLGEADLSEGQFLRCDFGEARMDGARLDGGLFSASLFMRASLRCASARGADFFQALCRKTDFSGADLSGASLVQVELGDASFIGCRLEGLRLEQQRRVG